MEHKITVKDIISVTKGTLASGREEILCEHFCTDSRKVQANDTYVGIKGENVDGNQFYEMALKQGASCCILQGVDIPEIIKSQYPSTAIVLVENTVKALQQIAAYKRSLYDIPVVAITGSVGKTSTKDIVASVLSQKFHVLKTQGNFNNEIGLPLTVLQLKDHDAMVVEMGMNSFGEISLLTNIAKPLVAVITNVGTAHIGMLGSRENILKAKLEILEGLQKDGTVIINNDNDLLHEWNEKQNHEYNVITYGIHEKSTIEATEISLQEEGSTYIAKVDGSSYPVTIQVGGEHFVYNSLCAIAVSRIFKIPMEQVLKGILEFELTKKRMEIKKAKNGAIVINDCYNANYDSMKAALDYLGKMPNNQKIAVLGDMLELGEYSKELHEKVGEAVAENHIDLLICVGNEAKNIAKKAEENGMKKEAIFTADSNEKAIAILQEKLQKDDVVLLKASNSMNFTQICEAICK
ncbi:MAG: UDP-N-acetylmuramoyl-tripeptide--D-alanyl-D-alanine ligase [Clostridia bacterium]|nr:UDP-N-acetylmuramoyl-tripeptide--D-alanyl-D-alanine ligase [Clostridia bacterium]